MANYIDSVLIGGERVIHRANLSMWNELPLLLLGVVLLPLFGAGLLVFLAIYIKVKSTELAITNKRVIAKFGFISRSTVELNINKIESLQVHQTLLGRLFNFGSLVIAGAGEPQAPIPGIARPLEFRRYFMEAQEQATQLAAR
ncbi:PH domain-containing protein [Chitinimonas taiwanensis]|uniref:PH domain-containing protein n=1 Tax=Chitinimonas taiwanensis DSM 18899 TaxID=1121279 RepID=A0A1K2HAK1_9NEIS|nr:PH domain-containing protein [Chitinimonas taiwanensis]SFZ73653.1 PH domain-containing protein [Chitinimonas taiwanensis DSM 18899]